MRTIFHIDINHCYAQIEEMKYPELRNVPMAVGGHEEKRHGIILAKNDYARSAGVKTGESLREAKEQCPDLLIIPPHYDDYIYYTDMVKHIYADYSPNIESFGLDEAWIDYTDCEKLFGNPLETAHVIQNRILTETGLTVSVGISWNKIFAKLGSDMKKPSGFTVITPDNFRETVWPQPVQNLLYVGPATYRKLHARGILTIGDLAEYPVEFLKAEMGISGEVIHAFANGRDSSAVGENGSHAPVKSVGNSMTMIHDVCSLEELKPVLYMLCEAVASRLRDHGLEGDVISVSARSADMNWYGCERKIERKSSVSTDIMKTALFLLQDYDFSVPMRAIGVSVSHTSVSSAFRQVSLFEDEKEHEKQYLCDVVMDEIRNRYGFEAVRRLCTIQDRDLTDFNVKQDHTVHPVGYFQGRKMVI